MINIKKGTGHSLQQSDKSLAPTADEGIVAGMILSVASATGKWIRCDSTGLLPVGFAVNNQTDGDVVDSGKLGVIMFDGNSVIETDQVVEAITAANFPIGTPVFAFQSGTTAGSRGKVTSTSSSNRLIGYVEGIRTLPAAEPTTLTTSTSWVDRDGNTQTASPKMGWTTVTLLGIKLGAGVAAVS